MQLAFGGCYISNDSLGFEIKVVSFVVVVVVIPFLFLLANWRAFFQLLGWCIIVKSFSKKKIKN